MAPLVLEAFFHEALDNSGAEASLTRFLPDGVYFQVCGARPLCPHEVERLLKASSRAFKCK
jgi:hypothetical protein